MRPLLAGAAILSAAALVVAGSLLSHPDRARHVAVPVLVDPSTPRPAGAALAELPPCRTRERLRVPARVTAVLAARDGALWVGTFDAGLFRAAAGEPPRAVGEARGRELFVNDLAEHGARIWAASQSGVLELAPDGRRLASWEEGRAIGALALAGGALYGAAARGLVRLAPDAPARFIEVAGPEGEPVRVTALAESAGRLWLGSPSGAFSLPTAALDGDGPVAARWHPLVFGDPGADTLVVTALAPSGDGVLAGTDDGGLVRLGPEGSVRALRFSDPRADEVNTGAAAPVGPVVIFGTQGGGLVAASAPSGLPRAGRPRGWVAPRVSALRAGPDHFLAGTADGAVLEVRCDPSTWQALAMPGA